MCSDITQLFVGDVIKRHQIVTLYSDQTVEHALRIFEERNISSAPVFNVIDGCCLGFIDSLDCVAHLVHTAGTASILSMDDWESIWQKNLRFTMQKIGKVVDFSSRNPFGYCSLDSPLPNAIETLGKGIHRLIVRDEKGSIVGILTQSTIVRFMAKNPQYLKLFANQPHSLFGIGRNASDIIKVYDTTRTLDAFRKLFVQGITGIAVISGDGSLISQLSASDLRHLGAHTSSKLNLRTLLKPVNQYLEICRLQLPKSYLVKANPEDTLYQLIKLMTENGVHRVWIVDTEDKLFGVVTMTDVMKVLAAPSSQ